MQRCYIKVQCFNRKSGFYNPRGPGAYCLRVSGFQSEMKGTRLKDAGSSEQGVATYGPRSWGLPGPGEKEQRCAALGPQLGSREKRQQLGHNRAYLRPKPDYSGPRLQKVASHWFERQATSPSRRRAVLGTSTCPQNASVHTLLCPHLRNNLVRGGGFSLTTFKTGFSKYANPDDISSRRRIGGEGTGLKSPIH